MVFWKVVVLVGVDSGYSLVCAMCVLGENIIHSVYIDNLYLMLSITKGIEAVMRHWMVDIRVWSLCWENLVYFDVTELKL